MTVTLTYDNVNAKVSITANALAAANYATVERSINQVTWTMVRGGVQVPVSAGAFVAPLDDYEFTPGVVNYYRVRGVETAPITLVGHNTTVTDANVSGSATLSPALPAGVIDGDLCVLWANIRNKGAGQVAVPAGWTELKRNNNVSMLGRVYTSGMVAPTVTFTGGVANATITAKILAFRSAALTPIVIAADTGVIASQQNVPYPALNLPKGGLAIVAGGWKQDLWTSVVPISGSTEIQDIPAAVGTGASTTLDFWIQTTETDIPAGSWAVTGGVNATSTAILLAFDHAPFLNEQVTTITPVLDRIWLKSLVRPFLNRIVTVVGFSDPVRPGRSNEHDVVSRTLPVGVNDIRSSRRWTVDLYVSKAADAQTLDYILAAGDVMLLQVPAGCDVPGGYVQIKDYGQRHPDGRVRGASRIFTLPLVEFAPPGPDVAATIGTWTSVLAGYATWDAVLAAFPTWADLLALHGDPSEVIVS